MGKAELYEHYKTDSLYGFNEDVAIIDNRYIFLKNGTGWKVTKNGLKEMPLTPNNHGYLRFSLYNDKYYAHRVMAMLFIPNPEGLKEISHEDNDKTNNSVENLKWCTRQYNNKKMFIDGIRTSEEMRRLAHLQKPRFNKNEVAQIKELLKKGSSDEKIAKLFNCSEYRIYRLRKGCTYARNRNSV